MARDLYWMMRSFRDPGEAQTAMTTYGRWVTGCYNTMSDLWPYTTDNYPRQTVARMIDRRAGECDD